MDNAHQLNKHTKRNHVFSVKDIMVLSLALMLVICAMTSSAITARKPVHLLIDFPFSNIVFAMFTLPIIDAICELYGKRLALFTSIIGVLSQLLFVVILEISIFFPASTAWTGKAIYSQAFSSSILVVIATIIAMLIAQLLDITIFQYIKRHTRQRFLWLRTSISSIVSQFIDSAIFIYIVFFQYHQKMSLLLGLFISKLVFTLLAIPITYLIVYAARRSTKY